MIDLSDRDLSIVRRILAYRLPDTEVWASGSRVSGRAKPWSDLDLAIVTDAPLPMERRAELQEDFAESDMPFRVDIIDWSTVDARFQEVVRRSKVTVWPIQAET